MNIIFVSPPAAGKGTHSLKIVNKFGLTHISTGNLLREASKYDNKIKEDLKEGKFISDEITLKLLFNKIEESNNKNGYVLDGFPRNINQAKAYDVYSKDTDKKIDYVIFLDLSKEESMKRIIGREICSNCGTVFNSLITELNSQENNVCDKCGHSLYKRDDDNIESFEHRYSGYMNETVPLIEYYKNQGILYRVDSSKEPEKVFSEIEKILKDY